MDEDGDHNTGGLVATAMRILNAIPAVCEAQARPALDARPAARHRPPPDALTLAVLGVRNRRQDG